MSKESIEKMGPDTLEILLKRNNQRFVCVPAGSSNGEATFTASITHEVSAPLTTAQLKSLQDRIGDQDQLLAFYKLYGSVRLYCDTRSYRTSR